MLANILLGILILTHLFFVYNDLTNKDELLETKYAYVHGDKMSCVELKLSVFRNMIPWVLLYMIALFFFMYQHHLILTVLTLTQISFCLIDVYEGFSKLEDIYDNGCIKRHFLFLARRILNIILNLSYAVFMILFIIGK